MKKMNKTLGSKILLLAAIVIFQQCGKGDDGGGDPYGTPNTEPAVVTITASNFTTNFIENPEEGATIGTIQASASSGSVRFSIVSQSESGAISINATTGQITVASASLFDFETLTVISAVVRVTSGSVTKDVTATINIVDADEGVALTLWEGANMTITKPNGADSTLEENQDRITENVWLTRGNQGVLYNAVNEEAANNNSSPAGTEWAQGTFADIASLNFTNFLSACPGNKPPNVVGIPLVLHLIEDDIYIEITITSWARGKLGGFTYQRTTP